MMGVQGILIIKPLLGGGNSNIFYFHLNPWGRFPILMSIFFRWVETTN